MFHMNQAILKYLFLFSCSHMTRDATFLLSFAGNLKIRVVFLSDPLELPSLASPFIVLKEIPIASQIFCFTLSKELKHTFSDINFNHNVGTPKTLMSL